MQANFPSSITASLILHALVAAAVVLAATLVVQQQDRPAAVFVLVPETASLASPQTSWDKGDQPRLKIPAVLAPAPSETTEPRAPEKVVRQQPAAAKIVTPVAKVGGEKRESTIQHPARPNSASRQVPAAAHEPPPGVGVQLAARVTFDLTASGVILNPKITKSSGSKEFDESVLAAFRRVRSIGPTPNGKADALSLTFDMKDAG